MAREIAYPLGRVLALGGLAMAAQYAGDLDGAVRLARQARQITTAIPGSIARWSGYVLVYALIEAGDLAAAETTCAAALAQARDIDDLQHQAILLSRVVILELEGRAARVRGAGPVRRGLRYLWADGIHVNIRLEEHKLCLLVMIGVRADGRKELIALAYGYRESAESRADLLRDCARRGMRAPVLAAGDGALGF